MIYRNSSLSARLHWLPELNPDASEIARNFLTGEWDLMRLTLTSGDIVNDLAAFLDTSAGLPLVVRRAASGEILISVDPWSESLLLTGRTADVLSSYLDQKIVRMEDRFDMTVRHGGRAM
jgi:hypothetical protein